MPDCLEVYRLLDGKLEANDYASAAVAAGLRIYSEFRQVLNADGTAFPVADVIEEVLKVVEEIKAKDRAAECGAEDPRAEVVAALARGEDAAALRKKIYEAYLKAEDAGRLEESAKYNGILDEWQSLIEEIQQ